MSNTKEGSPMSTPSLPHLEELLGGLFRRPGARVVSGPKRYPTRAWVNENDRRITWKRTGRKHWIESDDRHPEEGHRIGGVWWPCYSIAEAEAAFEKVKADIGGTWVPCNPITLEPLTEEETR